MDKQNAEESLGNAQFSPKLLLFIHSGALLAMTLVSALISYLLQTGVKTGGGLDAMNSQAMLAAIQEMLLLAQAAVTPFWTVGLLGAAVGIARGNRVGPKDLAGGFRKIGPVLSSGLMIGLQYLSRIFVSAFLSAQLFTFTPMGVKIYSTYKGLENATTMEDLQAILGGDYLPMLGTMFATFLVVLALLLAPAIYRYRMTSYLIMDEQERGGLRAMFTSRMLMQGNGWELGKLDLSFWWYYLLLMLGSVLAMGNQILPMVGVQLPMSETAAYWLFMLLGVAVQLLVKTLAGPKVEVTYAHRYLDYLERWKEKSQTGNPQPVNPFQPINL